MTPERTLVGDADFPFSAISTEYYGVELLARGQS
jgi:hypothetical protein